MANQATKSAKKEIKIVKSEKVAIDDTCLNISNLQAVELFNLSFNIRSGGKDVLHADKVAATRNFITLLPFKRQHEEIVKTISDEFTAKYQKDIDALQAETDKEVQQNLNQELVKKQTEYFENDLLLLEFCKKECSVKLESFSLEICVNESVCSSAMLVILVDLNLLIQ
jgi:hypothetical protein